MLPRRAYLLALALPALLASAASAGQPPLRPGKVTVYHYDSELDGTRQPFSVWLPRDYTPAKKFPLWVQLHGLGGSHRIGGARRENEDGIVVSPDGRGATDYKLWGEDDVVRVVHECKKLFSVDADRVYLYGFSMGGSGSWQVGVHYPDLFAALGPVCGNADHRVWERLWDWGEKNPTWMSPRKRWMEATESAAFFAENLINLPAYACHGTKDNVVPVGHARSMVEEIERYGGTVLYDENPDAGHGIPGDMVAEMLRWMKEKRRNPWPHRVVFKTAWRRHRGAYWVRVHRFLRAFEFARIEAEVEKPNRIRVQASNVGEFSLHLVPPLIAAGRPVEVVVNGHVQHAGGVPKDGWLRLRKHGEAWRPSAPPKSLHKTPTLEGPVYHAFMSGFIIVHGTGGDDTMKRVSLEEARVLADRWNRWARGKCRVKPDRDVTPDDIRTANLILVGDVANNSLIRRVMGQLPIRIEGNTVHFGARQWQGDDLGLKLVYPNPLNPQRYVALFTGTTWRGVYQVVGRFGNWFDWGILDGWHWQDFAIFDDHTYSPETFLAVGYFDDDWKLSPDWYVLGDEALRTARPTRRTPSLLKPPADAGQIYLSDLRPAHARIEKGAVQRDRSFSAHPITLGGRTFERGLGVHTNCDLAYDLAGQFGTFEAVVGTDLEGAEAVSDARDRAESFEFMVIGDGRMLFKTGRMRWNSPPRHIYVPIQGVRRLELKVHRRSGPRWLSGPIDWAIARVGEPVHNRVAVAPHPRSPERLVDTVALDGEWKVAGFPIGEGLARQAHHAAASAFEAALPIAVPGSIYSALPNPHDLDARRQAAEREWWLSRTFRAPAAWKGRSVWLELDGAAYIADCWLNGRWIGRTEGPSAHGRFDATVGLLPGKLNHLSVRVVASPAPLAKPEEPFKAAAPAKLVTSQHLARAGYAPLGIWRPVRLKAAGPCVLRNLHVETTELTATHATLRVRADIESVVKDKLALVLTGSIGGADFDMKPVSFEKPVECDGLQTTSVQADVRLPNPRRWWPWELGDQPLHDLAAGLWTAEGVLSDEATCRFGVRTIAFDTASSIARLRINGQRTLPIRGLAWTPQDPLLSFNPARVHALLRRARGCGTNLLRAWGGGLAEDDAFYDLCDRLGFLVIQEFPLASKSHRPVEHVLVRNVSDTITRLRSRASLAAWAIGAGARGNEPADAPLARCLAEQCTALDPHRTLILESPRTGRAQVWETEVQEASQRTLWHSAALPYVVGEAAPVLASSGIDSAALNAYTLRRAIERHRLAGSSYVAWQLSQAVPSAAPSLVDAAGNPKPAYYALRNATGSLSVCADFGQAAPTALAVGDTLAAEVCVTNLTTTLRGATVTAALMDGSMRFLGHWQRTLDVPRGQVSRPLAFRWTAASAPVGSVCFLRLLLSDRAGHTVASNLYWFGIVRPEQTDPAPRLRIAWLTAKPQGPLTDTSLLARAAFEVTRSEHPEPQEPQDVLQDEDVMDEELDAPIATPALPPISLANADVVAIDAATVLDEYTEDDLRAVADAVRQGRGLLIEGATTQLLDTPLAPLLPYTQVDELPGGIARAVAIAAPDHPAMQGLTFTASPALPRQHVLTLAPNARALLSMDASRPVLAERPHGRGRVFVLAADLAPLGRAQTRSLYARILACAGKLPEDDAQAVADAVDGAPLRALARIGPATIHAATAHEDGLVALTLTNTGTLPALMLHIRLHPIEGGPPAVAPEMSDNCFSLFPGETRTIRIAPNGAAQGHGAFELSIQGFNVAPIRFRR